MRFNQALLFVASIALLSDQIEARKPSRWAVERTEKVKHRLERVYGKGLVGMYDPQTGRIDPKRFGWDNRVTGGAPLGSSISVTITSNLTIDATTSTAYWLGFVKGMQYNGLDRDSAADLNSDTPLTNCFASTYSFLTSMDIAGYNWQTLNSVPGTFKGFDVLVIDPSHIIADLFVNYEMCEVQNILNQFKGMAGLDWAAVGDNLTRELMVIMVESPEARTEIMKVKDASQCVKGVADDYQEANASSEDGSGDDDEFDAWEDDPSMNFAADADPEASAKAAASCFDNVDRFTIGEISGKLFAHFFASELKPLI